jgi:7-cyano-7-deazaguanine tRNA-ribosyltransferase
MFEPLSRDGLARTAKFYTPHGVIDTPNILPVLNPNIKTLTIDEMKGLGMQGLITNSYIIRRNKGLREIAERDGLHSLMGYDGPIMTDSGTFQSHVYSEIEYDNLEIYQFQKKIGTDICTILDIFSEPNFSHEKAEWAVKETRRRLDEIPDGNGPIIAGPIQGSIYPDLRRLSAELMSSGRTGYLPVGGVVPLLEGYRYDLLVDIIINSRVSSHFGKPLHLFGGGHPMFMGMSVLLGIDMFDSASYVKYARDDRVLFSDGSRDLKKIKNIPWWSPIQGKYNIKEIQELPKEERVRVLSLHNLAAIYSELDEIKERIHEQTLWQYVEGRSRSHPAMYSAFLRILEYSRILEKYEDLSKKSPFFFFDDLSRKHPAISRIRRFSEMMISQYQDNVKMVESSNWHPGRPHSREFLDEYGSSGQLFCHSWHGIPVPVELEETYPVEQLISTGVGSEEEDLDQDAEEGEMKNSLRRDLFLERARMVARYQFGLEHPEMLFPDDCVVTRSRKTGRIRGIYRKGKLLGTIRAHDGFFTLSMDGGMQLLLCTGRHRVTVNDESAEFNAKGFNVFFRFITNADPEIIAGNEVIVVDRNGNFLATGKAAVSGSEMKSYDRGIAVKVRSGISRSGGTGA